MHNYELWVITILTTGPFYYLSNVCSKYIEDVPRKNPFHALSSLDVHNLWKALQNINAFNTIPNAIITLSPN